MKTTVKADAMKMVYVVTMEKGKKTWLRVGQGYETSDGALHLELFAIPCDGKLEVRSMTPSREKA